MLNLGRVLPPRPKKTPRLSQGGRLKSKATHELLCTFDRIWVRPYGPPEIIESDQESGLINDEAKVYFSRIGSELKLKGVGASDSCTCVLRHNVLKKASISQVICF